MKRRTWPRWRSAESERARALEKARGRGKRRVLACPVCDTPLVTTTRTEQGPRGVEVVEETRCPNPDCPRAREVRRDD